MLYIVVHHGIVHGLGLTSLSNKFNSILLFEPTDYPLILLVNSLCIVGVNCFIIISGYYKINLSRRKIISIFSILLFYSIILNIIPALYLHKYNNAISGLLFLSHSPYWFIIDYIFLMFFAPLLNMMFDSMSKRYIYTLLIVMTIISIYFGFLWNNKVNDNGYTFFQFIYMYCIGRYLRNIKLSTIVSFSIYLICSMLTTVIMYWLIKRGAFELAWKMTYYNNPLIIISSIGLFYVFSNRTFYSKKLNFIAKSALAVYIVQSSTLISKIYYTIIAESWQDKFNMGGVYC